MTNSVWGTGKKTIWKRVEFSHFKINFLSLVLRINFFKRIGEAILDSLLFIFLRIVIKRISAKDENKNILIVKPDGIGDVILCSPFIRELKKSFPDSSVVLVVNSDSVNLVECCPHVNQVISYNNEWDLNFRFLKNIPKAFQFVNRNLGGEKFGLGLLPRWDNDRYYAGLLLFLSAEKRLGYSRRVSMFKKWLNFGYDQLYTSFLSNGHGKHEVERNLDLIRFMGLDVSNDNLELWTSQSDFDVVRKLIEDQKIDLKENVVALGIGAREAKRRWPLEDFAKLSNWLLNEWGSNVVVVGSESDFGLGEKLKEIVNSKNIYNFAGKLTLRQTGALLSMCRLFVGNDSGPKHLAAAVGCPTIEISCHSLNADPEGSNSPLRFSAWGNKSEIIQPKTSEGACRKGCVALFPHCILGVELEDVKRAVKETLNKTFKTIRV